MKSLIDLALSISANESRYQSRLASYPSLTKFGCLPEQVSDIASDEGTWFCHGLAFRMATHANDCFAQWEELFNKVQQADGWDKEYENWNKPSDHWAKKWDRFHRLLWMLQCYEYFTESDHKVSFPQAIKNQAMPDMLVKRSGQDALYVECKFYSKWWLQEDFVKELLHFIDPNLKIERQHNVYLSSNPFSDVQSDVQFEKTLACLAVEITLNRLADLRKLAEKKSPQPLCEIGDVKVLLEGEDEYQPGPNAHGDPAGSWPIYVDEIIRGKKGSNNLGNCRPNLVLVNGLGLDFQISFGEGFQIKDPQSPIDEIWISKCGIDGKLAECADVEKALRPGYDGSGL